MKEQNTLHRIMLELGQSVFTKLFRNNTGMGWIGSKSRRTGTAVTLYEARPLHAGLCKGSSDIIGWHTITITPQMVGKQVAVFTAIEAKAAKGKLTPEQEQFLHVLRQSGGYALTLYEGDDFTTQFNKTVSSLTH